jgi:hypothetical protein
LTVNSANREQQGVTQQAAGFLNRLRDQQDGGTSVAPDDLLLFLYRLRDGYRIVRSGSGRFKGPTFGFLHEVLYQLESRPDETLHSPEWREMIESLMHDLESGRIILEKNAER